MLKKEQNYDFRKRMLNIHKENICDGSALLGSDELAIENKTAIYIPKNADKVILNAARDFSDFMLISMNVSVIIIKGEPDKNEKCVRVMLADEVGYDLGEYRSYRGYRVEVNDAVNIYANDSRGAAQALYYLEDLMKIRRAPFIKKEAFSRKPRFSPQMVHSGYGYDDYPNEHLLQIAHEGRDAILVFTRGANQAGLGFLDFNELIYRASTYGIDVYAYSYIKSKYHPDDAEAEQYYESTYGNLFKQCPGLKGVVLVGESVNFPSKDPNVDTKMVADDGIPSTKLTSFYYPCEDYVELVEMIKKVSRKYNPDADIVFWTYNFSSASKEARQKLIKRLPKDISINVTFEKSERYKYRGITEFASDYTLVLEGYSKVFSEEAEAALERGIRLYSMTNTGGMTWDMGTMPYEPMPFQWIKRYKKMIEAQEKWNLCGIMESHHFGIYPSFISKLAQWSFTKTDKSETFEEILMRTLKMYYGKAAQEVKAALEIWSEIAPRMLPVGEDQYGAFRVGPSYPFCLGRAINLPSMKHAAFGNKICVPTYCVDLYGRTTLIAEKIQTEIQSLKEAKEYADKGVKMLEKIKAPNEELLYLLNMGRFMSCYIQTGINAKIWHTLICKFDYYSDNKALRGVLEDMEKLLDEESENAKRAIEYVENDSRLGWEPSMEYMCDRSHIEWKLRQIDYVKNVELKNYKVTSQFI